MVKRKRDYKSEYRRRVERGAERGLSKAQARGHGVVRIAKTAAPAIEVGTPLWDAYKTFKQTKRLAAAARAHRVAPERLRQLIKGRGLAKRKGGSWIDTDRLPRRVLIYSQRREKEIVVGGYEEAALAGSYWHFAHEFVRTNDIELLAPFVGRGVKDSKGRFHPLETDPNAVHRLAAAGGPAFHEVYRIVQ